MSVSPPDPAVEVIDDDVTAHVQALKAQPGKDIPLFAGPVEPRPAPLTGHTIYPTSFALLRYPWPH